MQGGSCVLMSRPTRSGLGRLARRPWRRWFCCGAALSWAAAVAPVARAELALPPLPAPPPVCDHTQIAAAQECPGLVGASGLSWAAYADELYGARSLIFTQGAPAAIAGVHALLRVATSTFSEAFACLPALIATYFSLARLLALEGRLRRALAFLQLGFVFVRDKGFSECTPWPVQGWDMMLAGRTLTGRLRALDDESVQAAVPPLHREPGLRVAVVTVCAYAEDAPVRQLCAENRELYAAVHGYDMHFFTDAADIMPDQQAGMDVKDGVHKAFFWKVSAVKNVLSIGAYDWVLWMDCDAFFMDPQRTIDSVIAMHAGNSTPATRLPPRPAAAAAGGEEEALEALRGRIGVGPGQAATEVSLIIAVDSTGINNGVWMLKNTPWAHDFLHRWWHSDILTGPGSNHNCSDQSTMLHTLLHERAMDVDEAWDSVEGPVWPPEVRVAAQEHLQSFHQATAETAMSRAWQEGDFIKHHPGCHYYLAPCQWLYDEAESIFRNKVLALRSAGDSG